jgi:glycosyltransferase involved in cell wall biosynthesis
MTIETISVIIPVYNGARFLGEAIQSALGQTVAPAEIVVVDDGSTDGSRAVAAAFPGVRLVSKAHSGIAATLNAGVAHTTGRFLAFLDADDRWLPEKLARQMDALCSDPALAIVFGHCRRFRMTADAQPGEEMLDVIPGISKAAMLVTREAFLQVGGFTEDAGAHEFLDWYARAGEAGLRTALLPDILYERRIHDENMGVVGRADQQSSYFVALRSKLDRQRVRSVAGGQG